MKSKVTALVIFYCLSKECLELVKFLCQTDLRRKYKVMTCQQIPCHHLSAFKMGRSTILALCTLTAVHTNIFRTM